MGSPETHSDEPLTPAGKLFLRPETTQIIHCVLRGTLPIDVDTVKSEIENSLMIKHPRFCSLLVRDGTGGECWRRTRVEIDRHVVVVYDPLDHDVDSESAVNDYLADLAVSSPLGTDKPLWEIHVLVAHKCVIFRIHHALGDGISLMSLLMASCRRADDPGALPSIVSGKGGKGGGGGGGRRRDWGVEEVWGFVKMGWFTLVFAVEFVVRCLWVCDRKTPISGGAGVELWPRKLATARFWLEDMKVVKRAVTGGTINDVLFGIISYGLTKYLNHESPTDVEEGLQLTGIAAVNLREQPGLQELTNMTRSGTRARWGNKFGVVLLPVHYHKCADPLEYLKRAKTMIDRKKQSLEAHFSYSVGDLVMSCLGVKYASLLNYRIVCNTSFTISNVVGPQENVTLAGNPISYIRVITSSLPHAITMHMVSYAGKADLQILVAKDIIPDPEFLARCFEDALMEMKEAATTKNWQDDVGGH